MGIITVGIDLAKNIFAVHGVNEAGKPDLCQGKAPDVKFVAAYVVKRLFFCNLLINR